MTRQLLVLLHLSGAIVWIGGMFFAYFCLRPAAAKALDGPARLQLWVGTFDRFLRYTGLAVAAILGSGLAMLLPVGLAAAPAGWKLMLSTGIVMMLLYGFIALVLFPRLRRLCATSNWPAAASTLNDIRRLVALNLVLGLCTVVAAVAAR
jgi:uncharacterized membrane protein